MKGVLFFVIVCCLNQVNAQGIKYGTPAKPWDADSLGNHRVVVHFAGTGSVAKATIEWRRRDDHVSEKRIIVQDAKTRQKVLNIKTGIFTNDQLELWFQPTSGKGDYYVYYMPYKNEGRSNYPKGVYLKPEQTASAKWLGTVNEKMKTNAFAVRMESVDDFNTFYPMEVSATEKEAHSLVKKYSGSSYLVFPEDRTYIIKMVDRLPHKWIKSGPATVFHGAAAEGENYSYQLGVYALKSLKNLQVTFKELKSAKGSLIPSSRMTCINTGGIDYTGKDFHKRLDVENSHVQPLWCLMQIPREIPSGLYKGKVTISAENAETKTIDLIIDVKNEVLKDGGIDKPWLQTRLNWLNSTLAQENAVVAPYTPLRKEQNVIHLIGRSFEVNDNGMPKQIQTFFTEEMTGLKQEPNKLLTEPVHFHFTGANGKDLKFRSEGISYSKVTDGTIAWTSSMKHDSLTLDVTASLEFDGFVAYTVKATALQDLKLQNITFHIPFTPETAKYIMGLGLKGQSRPDSVNWKWQVETKNQDGAWIGAVNAGLQYSLRDEHYVRPLNTNFYLQKPLLLPSSWGNDHKGGITIAQKGTAILANNYTGPRTMKKGEVLYFNFNLLITPFHTLNTDFQWATRFYHKYDTLEKIKSLGASVINIHHATPINPWINYPFIEYKKMKAYIDKAHGLGLKVKIYNTVRELSDRAYETFPMRSLGQEIYSAGEGGGFSWLQEHLKDDYIPAWFVPEIKDAAIVNSGMSRWHNYYVEGMNWLTRNVGIDGIYLDDVAFDRVTMKRIKRVLTADGHPGIIDLHSANQYNNRDGFINSAMLYMEHFPYLNRLWFGEYFDYENNSPDFFLTEVSGIPFGLMGEMLQGGGNPWRGMVYGMTNRMPWTENADPRPIWKEWDAFGIQGSEMIGYWVSHNPVRTSDSLVKASVYKKRGKVMIALASWAKADEKISLDIDWPRLGLDPSRVVISAPDIKNFQVGRAFAVGEQIPVEKGKGWILIIERK
jgi:hypothetical protein